MDEIGFYVRGDGILISSGIETAPQIHVNADRLNAVRTYSLFGGWAS